MSIEINLSGIKSTWPLSEVEAGHDASVMSMDDLLLRTFAENAVNSQQDKTEIMKKLNDIQTTTNPDKLSEVQDRVLNYSLHMSILATLTRKAVGAVETVVRA